MKLNKKLKNIFCLGVIPLCVLPVISCSCSKKPTPVPPGPEPELKAEIILEKTSYSYTRDYSQQMKHLDISVPFTIKHEGIPDGVFKGYGDGDTTVAISAEIQDVVIVTGTIYIPFSLNKDYATLDKYGFNLEDTERNIELYYVQHSIITTLTPGYCTIHGKYVSSSGKTYECYTEFTIDIK